MPMPSAVATRVSFTCVEFTIYPLCDAVCYGTTGIGDEPGSPEYSWKPSEVWSLARRAWNYETQDNMARVVYPLGPFEDTETEHFHLVSGSDFLSQRRLFFNEFFAAIFSSNSVLELGGSHAGKSFEGATEMALIREPCREGDLRRRHIGGVKQVCGIFDAQLADVVARGATVMLAKTVHEMRRVDTDGSCDLVNRYAFGEAVVQQIACLP